MLVPCKDGEVLEEIDGNLGFGLNDKDEMLFQEQCKQYQKAKEDVLFSGIKYQYNANTKGMVLISNQWRFFHSSPQQIPYRLS